VKKWRKRFVNRRITLDKDLRSGKPPWSDLCESLRALIDETPFISCKHMYSKLQIPKTTCLRVLHEDLRFRKMLSKVGSTFDDGERGPVSGHICWGLSWGRAPYQRTNFEHLLIRDELWSYSEYRHYSAWAPSKATL
jgi:hypothetical protein